MRTALRSVAAFLAGSVIAGSIVVGCDTADGRAASLPAVVEIESQRCDRPTVFRGVGLPVGGSAVLTAAHVVDGDLRRLTVDGVEASVVALDARTDLALVGTLPLDPPDGVVGARDGGRSAGAGDVVRIVLVDAVVDAHVVRRTALRVDDLDAGEVFERDAIVLDVTAEPGWSGAPVVSPDGDLVGVVTLVDTPGGATFATDVSEVAAMLAGIERAARPPRVGSSAPAWADEAPREPGNQGGSTCDVP